MKGSYVVDKCVENFTKRELAEAQQWHSSSFRPNILKPNKQIFVIMCYCIKQMKWLIFSSLILIFNM